MRSVFYLFIALPIVACVSHPVLKKRKVASGLTCELVNHAHRNSLPQLVAETVKQINSGSAQKLVALTSCEVVVGPPRSEAEGFATRENAAAIISQKLRGLQWQPVGMLSGDSYTLSSKSPSPYFELVFRRYDGAGWYFAGVGTQDLALRKKLIKSGF